MQPNQQPRSPFKPSLIARAAREVARNTNPLDMPFEKLSKPQRSTVMRNAGKQGLLRDGWALEPMKTGQRGKRQVYIAKKGDKRVVVAIRTSQDGWMGYPKKGQPGFGKSLDGIDAVITVVPDQVGEDAEFLEVFWVEPKDLESRFLANYNAHEAAGKVPNHPAMWLSLRSLSRKGPSGVGAGILQGKEPIGRFSIEDPEIRRNIDLDVDPDERAEMAGAADLPTTVPEAIHQAKVHIARITGIPIEAISLDMKFGGM